MMGPDRAADAIRKALSIGADKAVHLSDEAVAGSCAVQTARALATVVGTVQGVDLVIAGNEASDGRSGTALWFRCAPQLHLRQLLIPAKESRKDGGHSAADRVQAAVSVSGKHSFIVAPSAVGVDPWPTRSCWRSADGHDQHNPGSRRAQKQVHHALVRGKGERGGSR